MFLLLMLAVLVSPAYADSPEKAWEVTLSSDFMSDYMFRGFNFHDGACIQPSIGATYALGDIGLLGGNVWAHLPAEGDHQDEKFTELDHTLRYDMEFGPVSFGVGHLWYTYPRDSDDIENTAEYFASVSLDTILKPYLAFYNDYDLFDAQYYLLGFSHTLNWAVLGDGFNVTPYVDFGFGSNAEKVYSDDSGLMHVTYGMSFALALGDISVTPKLSYTSAVDDATVNEFSLGISFIYSI